MLVLFPIAIKLRYKHLCLKMKNQSVKKIIKHAGRVVKDFKPFTVVHGLAVVLTVLLPQLNFILNADLQHTITIVSFHNYSHIFFKHIETNFKNQFLVYWIWYSTFLRIGHIPKFKILSFLWDKVCVHKFNRFMYICNAQLILCIGLCQITVRLLKAFAFHVLIIEGIGAGMSIQHPNVSLIKISCRPIVDIDIDKH